MNANMSQGSTSGVLNGLQPNYDFINKHGTNPIMIGILLLVVVMYYVVVHFGAKTDAVSAASAAASSSSSLSLLEVFLWILFIIILVLNGVRYFYDLDITTSIKDIFTKQPEVDINITSVSGKPIKKKSEPVPEITYEKQVFHVPGNNYDFSDAQAVCRAYGGKLATYDQVESAYKDGGEWCSYGWTEGQMALYPTQKKTYDKLQKIKGHEHDCGRPGINGGYIANPNVEFGINCYGYKPKITPTEKKMMELDDIYPKTKEEITLEKKVQEWRRKLSDIIVAPFNKTTWSKV